MPKSSEKPQQLNIRQLLEKDEYVIPIYQRNYAWTNSQISQLIQDVVDSYTKSDTVKPYYIGTLIAYRRNDGGRISYETIDGQQRLTTLTILLSLIRKEYTEVGTLWYKKHNLIFDSRPKSTETLRLLYQGAALDRIDSNVAIKQGYQDAKNALARILRDNPQLKIEDFGKYLLDSVYILRVLVPEDTDLNHYFEIMNSRGEQLEKHEILKAQCLEILDEDDRYAFNLIWEACSNMERYVQYGFTNTKQRSIVFGNDDENKWNTLASQEQVYSNLILDNTEQEDNSSVSIKDLIGVGAKTYKANDTVEESSDRFNTVINFSNFLLHILRIQTGKDIALDDKRLLDLFEPHLKATDKKTFVKNFGYHLLKGKFLFDKYVIKRDDHKNDWSLKKLKWYGEKSVSYKNTFGNEESNDDINREILMLLSMFHVSNPTLVYKHWLNAVLKYAFDNDDIQGSSYKAYLEELARTFMFDRYMAKSPKDFYEMIYKNKGKMLNGRGDISFKQINQGTAVENYVFNYIDYLLWQDYRSDEKTFFVVEGIRVHDKRISEFEYTFRSSVEHYYPQHPIEGNPSIALKEEDKELGQRDWLNNFGNLCLISNSKNSRLSNYMPVAKKEHYRGSTSIDSIKQRLMMAYSEWDTKGENGINEIKEHNKQMRTLLKSAIRGDLA